MVEQGMAGKEATIVSSFPSSNDDVASFYPRFLRAGFSVVTPNKKATSGSLALYKDILSATSDPRGPLL